MRRVQRVLHGWIGLSKAPIMKQFHILKDINLMPSEMSAYFEEHFVDVIRVLPPTTKLADACGSAYYLISSREEVGAIELNYPGDTGLYVFLRDSPGIADGLIEGKHFVVLSMFSSMLGGASFWIPKNIALMHPNMKKTIELTKEALGE